ncbi:MAG TPA: TauD/TfdA family dioxygenase [Xanthobacteraceae bacterium]|jgi:taurine dioxygenase|nr:TauD/TfdA family dioxygenase [Xanthobacteraceae bacterium]
MNIIPTGQGLGATIEGLDLAAPITQEGVDAITRVLGQYGVIRFPRQQLTGGALRDFSARFGELEVHVSNVYQEPGIPEVMVLSNMVENGKPIGLSDAGQDWHTDMSYARMIAFANVLYAVKVPRRDGVVLGNTEFSNMHAAYNDLPADVKARLTGLTASHDFDKFWSMMVKRPGSKRAPLSDAQRKARPPVTHPVVLTHPITGRKVLYANPGYTVKINELPGRESDELLEYLFAHQLQPKYRYVHRWQEGDVLMWENFGTIHNAIADYRPDEHRLVKRCQVMATRFFDADGAPRKWA